jgi:hypothetical protein
MHMDKVPSCTTPKNKEPVPKMPRVEVGCPTMLASFVQQPSGGVSSEPRRSCSLGPVKTNQLDEVLSTRSINLLDLAVHTSPLAAREPRNGHEAIAAPSVSERARASSNLNLPLTDFFQRVPPPDQSTALSR